MIVVGEYLAVRVQLGRWSGGLPDEHFGLPMTPRWRRRHPHRAAKVTHSP
jgi:hypothetical protein